jgi:hypothetical protein
LLPSALYENIAMKTYRLSTLLPFWVCLFLSTNSTDAAVPYNNPGPFVSPAAGAMLPTPVQVRGKEFSHQLDRDASGVLSPENNVAWDGNPANPGGGAGVANGNNYFGTQFVTPTSMEVDAIAHHNDALFHPVINDQAHLVFSIGNGTSPTGSGTTTLGNGAVIGRAADLSYEAPGTGVMGIWASAPTDIDSMTAMLDLDGVELWGPEPPVFDSNRYSLSQDAGNFGISVYCHACTLDPYFAHAAVVETLAQLIGPLPAGVEPDEIDLDAMMVSDPDGPDSIFGTGDEQIMFSVRQIRDGQDPDGFYVTGSEIFVVKAPAAAGGPTTRSFLSHGGHLWDHDWTLENMVTGEGRQLDVNALEAVSVPEPGGLSIVMLASWFAIGIGRRRSC